MPSLSSTLETRRPGVSRGTMKALAWWAFLGASGWLRAKMMYTPATLPLVTQSLLPSSTQSSPSRRALQVIAVASEPAPASDRA